VLNALNHKTIDELGDAFDRAAKDDAVRALILTGAGEKSFVAGVTSTNSRDRFPKKR
jgi:enoyl-CoA hydratase